MTAPQFAARLLSLPGFADEAEYRLGEAAEQAAALMQAIDRAAARLAAGEPAKRVAFDLVAEHPPVQTLAAFAEVGEADRVYLHRSLKTADAVRAAVDPLIARLDGLPQLQVGLGEAIPGLSEVRLIGPPFEVDLGRFFELLALKREDFLPGDLYIDLPGNPPAQQDAVWHLVSEAMAYTFGDMVDAHRCRPLTPVEHPPRLRVGIEQDIAVRPQRSSLLQSLCFYVVRSLEISGLGPSVARAIVAVVPAWFEYNLLRHIYEEPLGPWPIDDIMLPPSLSGAVHAAELRAAVWRPLLGQRFALHQIYVRPRGALVGPSREHMAGSSNRGTPTLVDVHRALDRWFASGDTRDPIRVISGAPGAGKSSLARMYAAECSRRPGTTLYVPLHSFDLGGDFRDAIRSTCEINPLDPFDPFAPARAPLLLILDGLDEFALRGATAASNVGQLVDAVCRTAESLNQQGLVMRALLLGREMVVQGISDRFRKPGQIIELLPLQIEPTGYQNHADPDGVRDVDQRHIWWRRYGALTGEALDGIPPELDTPAFEPLTREPLLAMLLAIARKDGLLPEGGGELSLGELYRRLMRQVYDRVHAAGGPQRLEAVQGVEFEDYERFLWAIAEAAWHGAGRTAAVADIRRIAGPRLLERLDTLTRGAEDPVSRLMTAFYFREHRGAVAEQKTFEFTHQSFAEYLLASRLIDFLDLLVEEQDRHARGRGGWSRAEAAWRWYDLFGPAPIEPHVVEFLRDAVTQRGPEIAAEWQTRVTAIIDRVTEQSFPVELGARGAFLDEARRVNNAGCALLVFASVCAGVSKRLTTPGPKFYGWVQTSLGSRLEGPAATGQERRYLDRIDWQPIKGTTLAPAWDRANLTDGQLDGLEFWEATLKQTRFGRCSLARTRFAGCRLLDVDLTAANLEGAIFGGLVYGGRSDAPRVPTLLLAVRLHGANLAGARLHDVVFTGCTADSRTIWPDGFDPIAAGITIEPG